jgi:hypothetical protein
MIRKLKSNLTFAGTAIQATWQQQSVYQLVEKRLNTKPDTLRVRGGLKTVARSLLG